MKEVDDGVWVVTFALASIMREQKLAHKAGCLEQSRGAQLTRGSSGRVDTARE